MPTIPESTVRELEKLRAELATERQRAERAEQDNAALLEQARIRRKHRCKEQIALDYAMKAQGHPEAIPHDTEHPGAALLERMRALEKELAEAKEDYDDGRKFLEELEEMLNPDAHLSGAVGVTLVDDVRKLLDREKALKLALGTRGRADCPQCKGVGIVRAVLGQDDFGKVLVECPCRKELFR